MRALEPVRGGRACKVGGTGALQGSAPAPWGWLTSTERFRLHHVRWFLTARGIPVVAERKQRLIAFVSAVAINVFLAAVLLHIGSIGPMGMASETQGVRLRWIPHSSGPLSQPLSPLPQLRPVRSLTNQEAVPASRKPQPETPNTVSQNQTIVVTADDRWEPVAATGIDLDASAMRRITGEAVPERLGAKRVLKGLHMTDGLWGRMAQASDCKDLRLALRANPGSTATIIASMRRRGCIH